LEDFSSVGLNLIPDRAKSQSRAHILSVEMAASVVGKTHSAPTFMQLCPGSCGAPVAMRSAASPIPPQRHPLEYHVNLV
jgi:hypothetical protein